MELITLQGKTNSKIELENMQYDHSNQT